MRVIIIGCGRVGAATAVALDKRGDHVTVIDVDERAFARLPTDYSGVTMRGNGTDEDMLRSAEAEMADIVMALTEGDNRNAMAAQLAKHVFGVPRVIAKINDPLRATAYRTLGLETICRTNILSGALATAASEGAAATNGMVEEPTAEPMRGVPPAGSRAEAVAEAAVAEAAGAEVAGAKDAGAPVADAPAPEEG
ncbi:MAG TPA: TrkA family potassium uptake protein [Candidatus Limnocylindria bacterium]|nr:TrkA family potassium uptake protein [Candidatus Limnocylindria bacterium]